MQHGWQERGAGLTQQQVLEHCAPTVAARCSLLADGPFLLAVGTWCRSETQ